MPASKSMSTVCPSVATIRFTMGSPSRKSSLWMMTMSPVSNPPHRGAFSTSRQSWSCSVSRMEGPDTSTTRTAKVNSSTTANTTPTRACTHSYSH